MDPRQDHPDFFCMDCDADTYVNQQYYMLLYKVWRSINYKIDGMLCLPCAEKRLGRPLTREDFSRARINAHQAEVCPSLAERLSRTRG